MSWKDRQAIGLLFLLCGLSTNAICDAASLPRSVLGNGGDRCTAAGLVNEGTLGQSAVGVSLGGSSRVCSGFWCAPPVTTVSVDKPADSPRRLAALGPPSPNPATAGISFDLSLANQTNVFVAVHDVLGRLVCVLVDGRLETGVSRLRWDGNRGLRNRAPAGVYFVRAFLDGRTMEKRFVLLR